MTSSSHLIAMNVSHSSTFLSPLSNTSSSYDEIKTVSHRFTRWLQTMTSFLSLQILAMQSQPTMRRYIDRDREGSHQRIWRDYFTESCTYLDDYFSRRFRMQRELFIRILNVVEMHDTYFIQNKDCRGRFGCSSI